MQSIDRVGMLSAGVGFEKQCLHLVGKRLLDTVGVLKCDLTFHIISFFINVVRPRIKNDFIKWVILNVILVVRLLSS
jgi:hypothetical protein